VFSNAHRNRRQAGEPFAVRVPTPEQVDKLRRAGAFLTVRELEDFERSEAERQAERKANRINAAALRAVRERRRLCTVITHLGGSGAVLTKHLDAPRS
jgi:hypothetical protein